MTRGVAGRIVIVGAGHAGFTLAAELRSGGHQGPVTVIDSQRHTPYQRPPLSKSYLLGHSGPEALAFRSEGFLEQAGIGYRRGETVAALDRRAQMVRTDSGDEVPYDAVVLATGARARTTPFDTLACAGAHVLRTRDDADAIRREMETARRVIVVGGGFIGLEMASVANERGLEVIVVESQERLMSRALGPTMSQHALVRLRAAGIQVRLSEAVRGLVIRGKRVRAVELALGEMLPADLVVVGTGVEPATELAAGAGLAIDNGIAVDQYLETSDPAIHAIGDCCSFPSPLGGERVRLESVQNATDQARTVARALLGAKAPYTDVPWFWSDQAGMKLQMAGIAAPSAREVVLGDSATGRFSVLHFDGDVLVCGESVNASGDHVSLRTLVAHGRDPWVREALGGGSGPVDLKALARELRRADRGHPTRQGVR